MAIAPMTVAVVRSVTPSAALVAAAAAVDITMDDLLLFSPIEMAQLQDEFDSEAFSVQ